MVVIAGCISFKVYATPTMSFFALSHKFYSFSYKRQAGLVTFIRFNPLPVLRLF